MKHIAINLMHLKPGKTAGIVAYTINLIQGFQKVGSKEFCFTLLTSGNNSNFFQERFQSTNNTWDIATFPVSSERVLSRDCFVLFRLGLDIKERNFDLIWSPTYLNPFFCNVPSIVTVHDMRSLKFPENYSFQNYIYKKAINYLSLNHAQHIVCISQYTKNEVKTFMKIKENKLSVILNPVVVEPHLSNESKIFQEMDIVKYGYFYCISSLLPEKNLQTLLETFSLLAENDYNIPKTLILSGVGGTSSQQKQYNELIQKFGLQNHVINTGFVSESTKNILLKNAYAFLFPSVYEGFGLPPVEAMSFGTPVITTKAGAILEVTKGLCTYVNDPYNPKEWVDKIFRINPMKRESQTFNEYEIGYVTQRYLDVFRFVINKKGNKPQTVEYDVRRNGNKEKDLGL